MCLLRIETWPHLNGSSFGPDGLVSRMDTAIRRAARIPSMIEVAMYLMMTLVRWRKRVTSAQVRLMVD